MLTRDEKARTYLDLGFYNVTCDRCGRKVKSHRAKKEWTGLIVCGRCLDERHPQDFVRGRVDHMAVPVARPLPEYSFADSPLPPSLAVYGTLVTPLYAGPESVWDLGNAFTVTLIAGALSSVQELDVLNGANMAAIESSLGVWEIIQFQNVANTSGSTYVLSKLLRGHIGTELNMGNPAPAGSRFVFIGQSGTSTHTQIVNAFDIGDIPFSPVFISAYLDNGDIVISWVRRSKIPRIDQDDYDPMVGDPLGESIEKYGVDILDTSGNIKRTIYAYASTQAVYGYNSQIIDFGSIQTSYSIRVYQISQEYGNGTYRSATITISSLQSFNTLWSDMGMQLVDNNLVELVGI